MESAPTCSNSSKNASAQDLEFLHTRRGMASWSSDIGSHPSQETAVHKHSAREQRWVIVFCQTIMVMHRVERLAG